MIRLKHATLAHLDNGLVTEAFDRALEACLKDIDDRPREMGKRIVTLRVVLKPDAKKEDEAIVAFDIVIKQPAAGTSEYRMLRSSKSCGFVSSSAEDPRQGDLFEEGKRQEKGNGQ